MDRTAQGERLRLGVIEGDGIGPEVVGSARQVVDEALSAAGATGVDWVPLPRAAGPSTNSAPPYRKQP